MITLTAYTEPIPVNPVSEQPQLQTYEPDENEEQSNFAELLAGLMRNTGISRSEVPPADFSESETDIDILAGPELQNFGFPGEIGNAAAQEIAGEEAIAELTDTELSDDERSFPLSAEHLFAGTEAQVLDEETAALAQEAASLKPAKPAEENTPKTDFSQPVKPAGNDEAAQTYAVMNDGLREAKKSLSSETEPKKTRSEEPRPLSGEKTQEIAAVKKSAEENAALQNKPQEKGRLDEARSRSRKDKVTIEVRDMRTASETAVNNTQTRSFAAVETSTGRAHNSAGVQEMTLELRLPDHNNSATGSNLAQASWETGSGNALENMLARELHQNFNGDIVRHASMALRDGGEGTIRIALKPDSLGNVKIHLELTENKITGRITVESEEALNAFKKELSNLEQSFKESGFEDASLNLSLTADGKNSDGQEQQDFRSQIAAGRYDVSVEQNVLPIDVYFGQNGLINMLA